METVSEVENNSELINVEKRSNHCGKIKHANIVVVNSNYEFEYIQYQDQGIEKTAISSVNGCGPKEAVFGIDANTMKKIPFILDGTFTSACNMHDICYICKQGKSTCDKRFKDGMMSICGKKYPFKEHPLENTGCKCQAELFYAAVAAGGKNPYNSEPINSSPDCASCGVELIQEILVNTPFYVML